MLDVLLLPMPAPKAPGTLANLHVEEKIASNDLFRTPKIASNGKSGPSKVTSHITCDAGGPLPENGTTFCCFTHDFACYDSSAPYKIATAGTLLSCDIGTN